MMMKQNLSTTFLWTTMMAVSWGATTMAAATVGARSTSCPCFTAEQYETILEAHPARGCVYLEDSTASTIGMAMTYLYPPGEAMVLVSAKVSFEEDGAAGTAAWKEGGSCGIGGQRSSIEYHSEQQQQQEAYGEQGATMWSPEAFQDCVDIMQAACQRTCADEDSKQSSSLSLPENHAGCGHLPLSSLLSIL